MTVMMLTLTDIFAHSSMCIETTETKTLCYKVKNYSDAISSNFSYKNYVKKI